jgi:hypothetical protein
VLSAPLANLRESGVLQRSGFLPNFCYTEMSYPSFTDGGSTDIALEQLERPLINNATGRKSHAAEYISLSTGDYAASHKAPTASWFYRITLDTWAPEILALIISAASIAGIIALLLWYEGTKSPQLSFGITLNAIVSILATTSRSMLIFAVSMCIGQLKWCWYHERKRKVEDIQTMVRAKKAVQRKLSSTQWLTLCVLSRMLQVVVL